MANNGPAVPEQELKQNSGVSASLALQAMQKAWDLRQAANAAGDPDAREKILAKAINKEIEAESFGKAAKYTRSGAFQGLAAGAGLGVQPGVTIGKLTGALVGGVISTVTGLLGGGIGSVYGAMNGPFWDLGEMASHGVRGVIGDFPNWKSTPSQQKALEKMVMQTKETQAPTKEELEQMKADAPDDMPQSWSQTTKDMTSWRPSMPSMPNMPSMPSMPQGAALGLGGLGAAMPSWGGPSAESNQNAQQPSPQQKAQKPRGVPKSKESSTPKEAPHRDESHMQPAPVANKTTSPKIASRSKTSETKPKTTPAKEVSSTQAIPTSKASGSQPSKTASVIEAPKSRASKASPPSKQASKSSHTSEGTSAPLRTESERKKPRKLATKSSDATTRQENVPKKAPRKLATRKPDV